jgi:hypothetical protein
VKCHCLKSVCSVSRTSRLEVAQQLASNHSMKQFAYLAPSERKCLDLINLDFFSLSEALVVCQSVFESRCFSLSSFRAPLAMQRESFAQIHCKLVLSLKENYIPADEKFTLLSNLPWQHRLTKAFLIADS